MSRGNSVRQGHRPQLSIATNPTQGRYEKAVSPATSSSSRPSRSASANPSSRGYAGQRDRSQQRRPPPDRIQEEGEPYIDDVYDMYSSGRRDSRQSNQRRPQQRYIEEEDGSDYEDGSIDSGDFDMLPARRPAPSVRSNSTRGTRAPEMRKIRIKVHVPNDVRYIMVSPSVEFPDLVERVRDKFNLRKKFKVKFKDEDVPDGDMITMGDQDDLDMAISAARSVARKKRQDSGKMDVSAPISPFSLSTRTQLTLFLPDLDF